MMKNTSYSITANVTVPDGGVEGVILAQGGLTGGHTLYVKDGKPKYCYNFFGLERYYAEGTKAIPAGDHQVRMEFTYDGGGVGKGGIATLYIDGVDVGERPHRADRGVPVLGRRDVRRRRRVRLARHVRLQRQEVHRRGPLGRARARPRRPQPPDQAGGSPRLAMGIQ